MKILFRRCSGLIGILSLCLFAEWKPSAQAALSLQSPTISSLKNGQDADKDGYFETYDFVLSFRVVNTGSAVRFSVKTFFDPLGTSSVTGPFEVTGAISIFGIVIPASLDLTLSGDHAVFGHAVRGNTDVRLRVEIWNESLSSKLLGPVSVTGPTIKADVITAPVIASIEPVVPPILDWDEALNFIVTINDSEGKPVQGATLSGEDGLAQQSFTTAPATSDSNGRIGYATKVLPGTRSGEYKISFTATKTGTPASKPVSKPVTVDHKVDVKGIVRDEQTHELLGGVTVSLAGFRMVTSSNRGAFAFTKVSTLKDQQLTATKEDYSPHDEILHFDASQTELNLPDILLSPKGTNLSVTSIKGEIEGIFLGGIPFENEYTARVNWNGETPDRVEFYANGRLIQTVPTTTSEARIRFDVARFFPPSFSRAANRLEAVAIDAKNHRSKRKEINVQVIPVPPLLVVPGISGTVPLFSVQVSRDLFDPGYSFEFEYPSKDVLAKDLQNIPILGRFGFHLSAAGGFEYAIRSGEWDLFAGFQTPGRWAGRRGRRPASTLFQPRFYLGNKELTLGFAARAQGLATQSGGIVITAVGAKVSGSFRGELLTFYLVQLLGEPIGRIGPLLDRFKDLGVDFNSLERVRAYGQFALDSSLLCYLPPSSGIVGLIEPGIGIEFAYEPDLKIAQFRAYAGFNVESRIDFPSSGSIELKKLAIKGYCGLSLVALNHTLLNEQWAISHDFLASNARGILAGKVVQLGGRSGLFIPLEAVLLAWPTVLTWTTDPSNLISL